MIQRKYNVSIADLSFYSFFRPAHHPGARGAQIVHGDRCPHGEGLGLVLADGDEFDECWCDGLVLEADMVEGGGGEEPDEGAGFELDLDETCGRRIVRLVFNLVSRIARPQIEECQAIMDGRVGQNYSIGSQADADVRECRRCRYRRSADSAC